MADQVTKTPDRRQKHKGWRELGGKRCYFKSLWEANYAMYLQWLKDREDIVDWDYEPETFWFEKKNKKGEVTGGIKRGTNNYKPDFRVTHKKEVKYPDGRKSAIEFIEVKGFMDKQSATKLNRMRIYHPAILLRLVDKAWFSSNNKVFRNIIPGWETAA
jgi:hypothetical protein